MVPKASPLHAFWVVLFAAAGALPALGQDQEDPELARALARRGWFDWANEICDKLEKSSRASADDKATGSFVKAEINLEMAEREVDVEKAKLLCTQSIDLLKDFIKKNAAHPLAMDARTNIGWLTGRKARFLKDALETEQDPTRHADLKKEAIQIYGEVTKFYQAQIDEYKKAKQTDAVLNALMDARLELPRGMLEHAKLVDEKDRRTLLVEAIRQLVDFEFDYGDRPICFEAMLEEGRCLMEMGDFKQAESKLRGTLALKARLAEAKIRPNDYHNKILYGAHVSLAQMLTRSGKAADAKTMIDQFFKENKGADKEWVGLAMKIEKADALFHLKDVGGAQALANEVMKIDPNGRFGIAAREKVRQWGSGPGGAIRFSPEQMMTAADSYIDKDDHRAAIGSLRKAIEGCSTDAEKSKFQPGAYYKMGQSLTALKRNYEAAYAFEAVFKLFPKAELAAKACFETARCYSNEFGISGNKLDDDLKEKYLTILARDYPKDPAARNIPYLQAEKIEATGDLKKAAERYFQVGEDAEAYESALVRSGYCYHVDATTKWSKAPRDAAVQAEVKVELRLAEEALQKFMARLSNPSLTPKDADLLKMRQNLSFIANQRLALIYMHDAVGRTGDALKFLEQCAKDIPADDERLAKIWQLQVQAHLAKKELEPAIKIVETMFEKFPDGAAIAQACKSVAINLDNQTADMIKNKADAKAINDNLKKVSKYYAKWLDEGPSRGLRITMADVVSVAEALYMIAKRLNALDENAVSFMDLRGRELGEKQYFMDAAFVHALLVDGKVGKLGDKEKILLMTRLARCYSFIANNPKEWNDAKDQYEGIVKSYKLIDARGALDIAVLQKHRELLGVYVEMGYAYYEIGRKGQKFQLDNASTVFSNLVRVTEPNSEPWWVAKYMVLAILFERGNDSDVKLAKIGVESLERSNPDFDAGKYGMKDKFLELRKKINQVTGGK